VEIEGINRPESLWGVRNDPDDNHPKHVFSRACDAAGVPDDRETRRKIAEETDIEILSQKCSVSFAPFRTQLEPDHAEN
jgi:hypothetical protein